MSLYQDRRHAGRVLAEELREYAGRPDVVVLALPRGGGDLVQLRMIPMQIRKLALNRAPSC